MVQSLWTRRKDDRLIHCELERHEPGVWEVRLAKKQGPFTTCQFTDYTEATAHAEILKQDLDRGGWHS